MNNQNQKDLKNSYYFSSPKKAVETITKLLQKKNFKALSRYYDLSGSEVKISQLESGNFFIRKKSPETAHPGGFWRYKHPFAPGFLFSSARVTSKKTIFIVEVSITIDQGPDFPSQIGLSYFYMIKSEKGWKILPNQVDKSDLQMEMPSTI